MKLGIVGVGGHSNAVTDIALNLGYNELFYFDDNFKKNNKIFGKFVGPISKIKDYRHLKFIIAIGDNNKRLQIYNFLKKTIKFTKLIHPRSYVSKSSRISDGVVIMPNATLNSNVSVNKFSIINSNSVVEHDSTVGQFTHVCPGVSIAGNVKIGDHVFVGIGSSIINDIKIGKNVLIGAGTNVIKDIQANKILFDKINYEIKKK